MSKLEQHYDRNQVAEMLAVSLPTVDRLIAAGRRTEGLDGLFPVYRLSHRCVRIPQRALNLFLERHQLE